MRTERGLFCWRGFVNRVAAALLGAGGRLALARGDLATAADRLERATARRPLAFRTLVLLARAYLAANDVWRAHRALARAREVDPGRFARVVARWGAAAPANAAALRHVISGAVVRTGWGSSASGGERRVVAPGSLPYGDCLTVDEHARFRAMPPISAAERASVDWDAVCEDLAQD